MALLCIRNKRYHINTVENHKIYTKPKNGIQISDRNIVTQNAKFKVLVEHEEVQMVSYSPCKTIRIGPDVKFCTFIKVTEVEWLHQS